MEIHERKMAFNPPKYIASDDDVDLPSVECNYYSPNFLKNSMKKIPSNFSIFTMNIRSCRKNYASLLSFLKTFMLNFTVIVLIETLLSESTDVGFLLEGYRQLNIYRNTHGGGIKVFYEESLSIKVLENLTFVNNVLEILTFYVYNNSFKYLLCTVYRPPRYNPNEFYEIFFDRVLSFFHPNDDVIITGDFNMDLYNPSKLRYIDDFKHGMFGLNYFPVLTLPCMINENNRINKYSLIDQVWSNFKKGKDHISGVIDYLISDHLPNFYMFSNNVKFAYKSIKFRLMKPNNFNMFADKVNSANFNDVYRDNDPDRAFNCFFNKLFDIYKACFPIKKKKIKNNFLNQPWVSPTLKKCVKKKYYLYSLLKRGLISRRSFNAYKKTLSWVIKKIKSKYYNDRFNSYSGDSKKTWNDINKLLDRKCRDNITEILDERGHDNKGRQMVEKFKDYL